jgi:nucleoside-diphosphate-sugar epimerase
VKLLLERGDRPVIFDAGGDTRRISALLENPSDVDAVELIQGDIRSPEVVSKAVRDSGAERIVHLAGHQIPLCREDPAAGGAVNVIGTLNVFEAARACGISQVAYASSAAVYGPDDCNADGGTKGPPRECDAANPTTHYGVFKQANEGNARVYFADCGISSVGLRPLTVYGVGRDFGMTSDPTRAMKAAVAVSP